MKKRLLTSLLLAGICPQIGCSTQDEAQVEQRQQDLWVAASTVWDNDSIAVCWTTSGDASEKSWVKDEIESTWEANTGLSFSGWDDCPDDLSSFKGIAIEGGDEMVVRGGLGQQADDVSDMELDFRNPVGGWTRCTGNGLNREDCIRAVAIHEFGHSLGLPHEHNRPDETACSAANSGSTGSDYVTPYDPFSIMNYCGLSTKPTPLDLLGAEVLYPKEGDLPVSCAAGCFATNDGPLVRSGGSVQDGWSGRGALAWWSTGDEPIWKRGRAYITQGSTLSADLLSEGDNDILFASSVSYTGVGATGASNVEKDDARWTAVAMTAL